ncbi:MAG: PD-(D/E)XK nuclease family protein [Proteobacteria bacterium]|uniref:PD-(D/E)XK nuclease family protein n=1 Tax=Ottowia sp. TaxID=1898956 RepID=UPI001DA1944A|nr:PD-(D/E)XK nuclease family protein [Ottowia sp.]MBS0404427.1 PD-(D/E)XK nuclease family protein [Pseudomonadota bacterium]
MLAPSVTNQAPTPSNWADLLARVHASLHEQAAHPARSVVLLPYAQLAPLAARLWAAQYPDGYAPRFESTRTWAARVGMFSPAPTDLSGEHGRDWLTAAGLLEAAGLGAQRQALAGLLLEWAAPLAPVAASLPPALRPDWAQQARAALPPLGEGPMALEAALGRIALAWAGSSDYATDVLFGPRVGQTLDALVIVPGLQPDLLTAHLAEHYADKATWLALPADPPGATPALHVCADGEDEAERAAACVLAHLAQGRAPVALVAGDRVLTRRISALLAARGVPLRDETGWTLSTTHAAARLVALLRAAARGASTDAVLDWLKLAPDADAAALRTLERQLRRDGVRDWLEASARTAGQPLTHRVEALRAALQAPRPLADWLAALREALAAWGAWQPLLDDAAGAAVADALSLAPGADTDWLAWPAARRRLGLREFTRWVGDTLEAASFRPPHPPNAPVVVLPLSQLLGRPFVALVLPGADEQRLPAAPEPPGPWTAAQRQALHLPLREQLAAAQAAAWRVALAVPQIDVLWRTSDDSGEPLLPSPWVQALRLQGQSSEGVDPRARRALIAKPVAVPAPSGAALPTQPLSASSYEMLRACPYRFFALRQLGLAEEGELEAEVDKRDFGIWLHEVLHRFHRALQADPAAVRAALLDAAAEQAMQALGLQGGAFLPFAVAWPAVRDGYLDWLAGHEAATGAVFEEGEQGVRRQVGEVALLGTFDRVDRLPDGAPLVIDYKTESPARTQARLKAGSEDTQLPFYALLTGHDAPQAAYLNVGEREPARLYASAQLLEHAAALHQGIEDDLARIAAGHPLRPLGEGSVCDWCAARGLCRRDFWS